MSVEDIKGLADLPVAVSNPAKVRKNKRKKKQRLSAEVRGFAWETKWN